MGTKRVYIQDVLVTADALGHRLAIVMSRRPARSPERQAAANAVTELLDKARAAALGVEPRHWPFLNWWRATLLEAAYQYIHAANTQIVELFDESDVEGAVPAALAKVRRQLGRDDPRRIRAEKLPTMKPGAARRTALREALDAAYAASDTWHRRQRSFRNIILMAAAGITLFLALVWALVAANPSYMPFCFDDLQATTVSLPAATSVPAGSGTPVVAVETISCPTGEAPGRRPVPGDITIILLMGLLGGSLAAAISIRNVRGAATPYDIPVALAWLKVPTGGMTAVVGLVAIRGNFVPGLSALDSQEQILAYALVLGYAQQLATGFLDRRAQSLAKDATPEPTAPVPDDAVAAPAPPPAGPGTPAGSGSPPVPEGVAPGSTAGRGRGRPASGRLRRLTARLRRHHPGDT